MNPAETGLRQERNDSSTTGLQPLPTDGDTQFLRACLHDGPSAREAWTGWLDAATKDGTSARRALVSVNAFLPLLAWNLSRNTVPLDRRLATHLRSAHLTEELRWQKYRSICESAFRALSGADIPFIGLKGPVVGELVYPTPVFRHADDIDVLLRREDLSRAFDLLVRSDWRSEAPPVLRSPRHLPPLVQPDGVPIELHWRLVIPYYTVPYDALWKRSHSARIAGVDIRVLCASDNLLHACAHGMLGGSGLRWVVDAWFILRASPRFDWPTFVATTIASRLELPVYCALTYLSRRLEATVPPQVLDEIGACAARAGFIARQAARPWPVSTIFPHPVQFALRYDVRLWTVPYYYFYRMARYVWRARPQESVRAGLRPPSS